MMRLCFYLRLYGISSLNSNKGKNYRTGSSFEYNVTGGTVDSKITDVAELIEMIDIQWLVGRIGAMFLVRLLRMNIILKTTKCMPWLSEIDENED